MSKYRSRKMPRYKTGRSHNRRDPYRALNLYNRRNIYNRRGYDNKLGMRRGYNSRARARSYLPSRNRQYRYPTTSNAPKYRPVPKRPVSYPNIGTPVKRYARPQHRIEPDAEELLKQLEKRFDKKLHEQVLERIEAEMKELQEALKEKREAVEDSDTQVETPLPETAKQEPGVEATGHELYESRPEVETEPTEGSQEAEVPTEHELYEIDDKLEWLRDETDEAELAVDSEASEQAPELVYEFDETLEQPGNPQSIEQPTLASESLGEVALLEEPVELELEQLADLESILDQIEPIEQELFEPIELETELLPELGPEPLEEDAIEEKAVEAEVY